MRGWRNVAILGFGQAVGLAGTLMLILLGGILGSDLAPEPAWATLPISLTVVGTALFAIPAALLMKRIGRRKGFLSGALMAGAGALLAGYAVGQGSFALFSGAFLLYGLSAAFMQQYRFAAMESVEPRFAGRAVSLVLGGGILSALVGPKLVELTRDWIPAGQFSGSFVSLAIMYGLLAAALLLFGDAPSRLPGDTGSSLRSTERPLRQIIAQPLFATAVLVGAVTYGVMSFVMTATPVHLHSQHGYSLRQTSLAVQGHLIAMFLPSLFTGLLLERLGLLRLVVAGVASMAAGVILGLFASSLPGYRGALILLGAGWNLAFVGSTVLLTRTYRPAERFRVQAVNEFAIFAVQATASLLAGTVLFYANWQILNLIALPLLALALAAVALLRHKIVPAPTPA
jgi:MFS family permease